MAEPQKTQQSDPWAEAAKNYKPQAGEPASSGNDDWKVWQQGDTASGGQSPDTRMGFQKTFDEETAENPNDPFGTSAVKALTRVGGAPIIHPVQFLKGLIPQDFGTQYKEAAAKGVQPINAHWLGNALGEGMGAGTNALMMGGIAKGGKMASGALGERYGGYKSPVIDPALQNASKLATAIRPPGGINAELEPTLATEFPKTMAEAKATGNPLHSQWEAAHAARGLAEKGLEHFNKNILGPNAEANVPVGQEALHQGFLGPRQMPEFQTIGQINDRLTEINNLTRPAGNAKTIGETMTKQERLGLDQEADFLRNRLYNELAKRTGISPDEIKAHREGYGKQFSIADTIDAARRARLGPVGASAEGASVPMSKTGLLEKGINKLMGSPEYMANRNFRKAASAFEPSPAEFPQPQYPQPLQGDQFNNPFFNKAKPLTSMRKP